MNERAFHPLNVVAAAVMVGGLLAVALPGHAGSIVRIAIVAVAAAVALHALAVHLPPVWWTSPFDGAGVPGPPRGGFDEVARIRAKLGGRRQPIEGGPPLPPDVLHLLKPLVEEALGERTGRPLAPATRAVLEVDVSRRPPWFRLLRPDDEAVARAVHAVLDDLHGPGRHGASPPSPDATPHGRAP